MTTRETSCTPPCQSTPVHHASSAYDACWPVDPWTSDVIARDWDTNSKIRGRQSTRNRLLYTAHAVGSRASRRCGQEVVPRFPTHTTRVSPFYPLSRIHTPRARQRKWSPPHGAEESAFSFHRRTRPFLFASSEPALLFRWPSHTSLPHAMAVAFSTIAMASECAAIAKVLEMAHDLQHNNGTCACASRVARWPASNQNWLRTSSDRC